MASAPEVLALRALVERLATGDASDAGRRRRLSDLRGDLSALLGQVDSMVGSRELAREGQAVARKIDVARARQRADIREELEREGRFTGEQLDALGYLSHGRLDELESDGLLESALAELPTPIMEAA